MFNATSFTLAEAHTTLLPLFGYIIGMVIYSVFIFKFYRFVAHRDIIKFNLAQKNDSILENM